MSLPPPACSTPVMAGACQWVSLPVLVVLIQAARLLVPPRIGERSCASCTADSLLLWYWLSPVNARAAEPTRPGVTHAGFVAPIRVPGLLPAESAVVLPAPSSKWYRSIGACEPSAVVEALATFVYFE